MLNIHIFASGSSGYIDIEQIHQRECSLDKDFEIVVKNSHLNPDNCSNDKTLNLSCDIKTYKTIVSMVIAAKMANNQMSFWLSGCDKEGQAKIKYPLLH